MLAEEKNLSERLDQIEKIMSRPQREYLSPAEAATFVGLSKQQLDIHRMQGGGPAFHKVGRRVLYAVSDLHAWMASHRREPLAAAASMAAERR